MDSLGQAQQLYEHLCFCDGESFFELGVLSRDVLFISSRE